MAYHARIGHRPRRAIPDDFALYASIEGNRRLRLRYRTNGDVIERWRCELGVRWIKPDTPAKEMAKETARRRIRKRSGQSEAWVLERDFDEDGSTEAFGAIKVPDEAWD